MIWGLSYLDFAIIVAFLVIILAIGIYAARSVKGQHDFYLGGRKMGKTLQFFLNFGNATDTNAAPTMAGQVYREGASGMWLQLQTLFITPFFWFTQPWFRRARVITMADLFLDRFNSRAVAFAYAMFNIMVALLVLGLGNLAGFSVVDAMIVKSDSQLTVEERASVQSYGQFQSLRNRDQGSLTIPEKEHLSQLEERVRRGELRESYGVLTKAQFYIGYNLIVAIYIMLGGLKAAAITDAVQGILILFMSIILLPLGLYAIGGFSGLHARVPDVNFWLSGTPASSFTWYSIAAVTLGSFIQIIGLQHNMASGGSAKDENTARFGMLMGGFTKRIVLICWMLCGLLAVAILSGEHRLANADLAWGKLSTSLLPIGLIGLMLSGMLLGHMPSVGMTAVAVSGLVVRNVYEPTIHGLKRSTYVLLLRIGLILAIGLIAAICIWSWLGWGFYERLFWSVIPVLAAVLAYMLLVREPSPDQSMRIGKAMIVVVLFASVLIAVYSTDLASLTALMITFNVFFGAVVFLLFFWRRLTVPAILSGFIVWLIIQIAVPVTVAFSPLRSNESLLLRTNAATRTLELPATQVDVAAGRATAVGESVRMDVPVPQVPVFFEGAIVTLPAGGREGRGRFVIENAIMYWPLRAVGMPMENFSKAGLTTTRWMFDSIFPFVMLILVSLLTRPTTPERAATFYAKQKTPVAPTPELDHEEIEKNKLDPTRWDQQKLLPSTNWEFCKWTKNDFLGFFGCWGIVLVILCFLWFILRLGKPFETWFS